MSKILIYDTEANSLDTQKGVIQELAYALYDSDSKRCLKASSQLLKWGKNYEVDPRALEITGLTRDFCEKHGGPSIRVFEEFINVVKEADYVVGHNILQFDNPLMISNLKACELHPYLFQSSKYIDTYIDIDYDNKFKNFSLKYLSLDHGYVLSGAHQALQDVYACAHILFSYEFKEIVERSMEPICNFAIYTQYADTEARDRLFNLKFRWNRETKRWEKKARKSHIDKIVKYYNGAVFVDGNLYSESPGQQMSLSI